MALGELPPHGRGALLSGMFVRLGASMAPRIRRASTYPLQEFFLFVTLQHPYQVA